MDGFTFPKHPFSSRTIPTGEGTPNYVALSYNGHVSISGVIHFKRNNHGLSLFWHDKKLRVGSTYRIGNVEFSFSRDILDLNAPTYGGLTIYGKDARFTVKAIPYEDVVLLELAGPHVNTSIYKRGNRVNIGMTLQYKHAYFTIYEDENAQLHLGAGVVIGDDPAFQGNRGVLEVGAGPHGKEALLYVQ